MKLQLFSILHLLSFRGLKISKYDTVSSSLLFKLREATIIMASPTMTDATFGVQEWLRNEGSIQIPQLQHLLISFFDFL
jgi:hypothetical protein